MNDRSQRVLWDRVALAGLFVLTIILVVWWLESRFQANTALYTVGLVVGIVLFASGAYFAATYARSIMALMIEHHDSMTDNNKAAYSVSREYAKQETLVARHRLRAEEIDAKRIDRLAQERQRVIHQNETNQQRQAANAPSWADNGDDSHNASFHWQE